MIEKLPLLLALDEYKTSFPEEVKFHEDILNFVGRHVDFWQRSNLAGHITGSAWVLSPDNKQVLLLHHKKLDRWLQPGGHVDEADMTVADTAVRETREECGLENLELIAPVFFDMDVHEIPARSHEPAHFHYDLRYACRSGSTDFEANLLEVKNMRWVQLYDLIGEETEQSIRRMALKSLKGKLISQGF